VRLPWEASPDFSLKAGPERPKENNMDRQTLSIMKACEVVGVSRRTIYNWISAGKVEYVRTAGGAIRIFADSLWRDAGSPSRQVSASVRPTGSHA
jgi:excisionase family DNA binding protein